jgi:tRNA-dihydrouridine synthase B
MNKNFWKEEIEKHKKLCFLAPMDGYGDSAYRQAMKRIAPHIYCISEFYSADGLHHSKFLAESVLPHTTIEDPLIIQIFGKDPAMFASAAKIISNPKYNIAGIDVNMGCPAKKVVRSGHGSSLLINEQTAFDIIKALSDATHLPISVKTRLSFDGNQDLISFAQGLQSSWASLITIHGRTAKQAYTGKADFTGIYELKKNLDIPVIANGDVEHFDDGMRKIYSPDGSSVLDGFMIGRRSFWNPWCFLGKNHISTNFPEEAFLDELYQPKLEEMLEAMEFHAEKLVETKGERKGSLEIRKHLVQYLKSFPGVKEYRKQLVTTESLEMTRNTLSEIRKKFWDDLSKRPGFWEIE